MRGSVVLLMVCIMVYFLHSAQHYTHRSVLSGVTLFCLCFSERYNDYDRVYLFPDNTVFICLI